MADAISLEQRGVRLYFLGNTFPFKDRIRHIGGHFDQETKQWWIGQQKKEDAEQLVASLNDPSGPTNGPSEDPKTINLRGRCSYKGRSYFFGASGRDGQMMRLYSLPDAQGKFISFWAKTELCTITKNYRPIAQGRGKWRQELWPTLANIAAYIEDQKDPDTRTGECYECGAKGPFGQACSECGGEGSYS